MTLPAPDWAALAQKIKRWGGELGFSAVAITDTRWAPRAAENLAHWLAAGYHGTMDYMARNATLRADPARLLDSASPGQRMTDPDLPGIQPSAAAISVASISGGSSSGGSISATPLSTTHRHAEIRMIVVRLPYLPTQGMPPEAVLADGQLAYLSRYALGRDYHKVMRNKLKQLAQRIEGALSADSPHPAASRSTAAQMTAPMAPHAALPSIHTEALAFPFLWRIGVDSTPVMEVEAAIAAGLGWRGKHTLLLTREEGSYFFLGEIICALPLPTDPPQAREHCGDCQRCLEACPTDAIIGPYRLDARRCISYLTIELKESIPPELRPLMGNRVYGCDDCQLVCPWNRFARPSTEPDFAVRHGLDAASLVSLFAWDEAQFHAKLAGSAIHRIGHLRWLRNLAVGLGNAPRSAAVVAALSARADHASPLVREHARWALAQHT